VGQGTFVRDKPRPQRGQQPLPAPRPVDLSMNLPPEPDDPELIERMQAGVEYVSRDILSLLRYQGFGGTQVDKDAASSWLGRRALVPAQERQALTYPGIRSIAAHLGIKLVGLAMDAEGVEVDVLTDACKKTKPKALYLNPTLQNPTTITISGGAISRRSRGASSFRWLRAMHMALFRHMDTRLSRRSRRI
jgi:hypothetical protein